MWPAKLRGELAERPDLGEGCSSEVHVSGNVPGAVTALRNLSTQPSPAGSLSGT